MNLYLRYYDNEVLVETLSQAFDFLSSIPQLQLDDVLVKEVTSYVESTTSHPKRFKVNQHSYFIMIKTNAPSFEKFKENAVKEYKSTSLNETDREVLTRIFSEEKPGWYKAVVLFKRVMPSAENMGKFQYMETEFEAKLKAHSIQDCYDRVISHLRTRHDIDERSQFPSIKGRNFHVEFLGKP